MRSELAKFVPRLLNDEQKHSCISARQELQEEVHTVLRLLSMVNTEEFAGIDGYGV
jgi:hypothetical protein